MALLERGYRWYELGDQHFGPTLTHAVDPKERAISFFKRGLGGALACVLPVNCTCLKQCFALCSATPARARINPGQSIQGELKEDADSMAEERKKRHRVRRLRATRKAHVFARFVHRTPQFSGSGNAGRHCRCAAEACPRAIKPPAGDRL